MLFSVIKVCGITNLADAEGAIAAGATALGFNFYPLSKRYLNPQVAGWVRSLRGVSRVGVFVNEKPDVVARITCEFGLDIVQLHGDEAASSIPSDVRVWKAFRVDAHFGFDRCRSFSTVEAFVLDGPAGAEFGGSGKGFAWSTVREFPHPVILAGGLDSENVAQAIESARPLGVDACSALESSPGIKDLAKVRRFVEAATAAGRLISC